MAIGPDLSHRNTQVDAVLAGEQVRAADRQRRRAIAGISPGEAKARAANFAIEIASDYSYGVVRALELFLSWLWTRLYDGTELHNFEYRHSHRCGTTRSFMCPATAAISTICCCRTSSSARG
jgi:glycerol-3-phosphate O-acyltransferase